MIRYFGHNPEPPNTFGDFIEWAGGKATSDDGQRQLFNPVHTFPFKDFTVNPDGTLHAANYRNVMAREFGKGLPVITAAFPSKFAESDLTGRLIQNPDNLMLDQFGDPFVPSNTHGAGDTYFVVDSRPGGATCEFLQTTESIQRQMATELKAMFVDYPEWAPLLIGTVVAGEMKYPHDAYRPGGIPRWFDYSPYAIDAYQWYTRKNIGPGRRWRDFDVFKAEMGIPARKFSTLSVLSPPRSADPDAPEWTRLPSLDNPSVSNHFTWWHTYRLWALRQHITQNARWWREDGPEMVYWGSQAVQRAVGWARAWSAMEPSLLYVPGVVPGISLYRRGCTSLSLLADIRAATQLSWDVTPGYGWNAMQWNPGDTVQGIDDNLEVLRLQFDYGAQVLNLHNAQPVEPGMLTDGDCAVRRWMEAG